MNTLVVARYSEDLHWLCLVPNSWTIHVYNKGAPIAAPMILNRINHLYQLDNIGRESETFLTHMVEWKGDAGEYTVFAQGDPFEHSPDFLRLLEMVPAWQDVQSLSWRWKEAENIPPADLLANQTAAYVHGLRVRPEQYSLTTWNPVDFMDLGAAQSGRYYLRAHELANGTNIAAHFLSLCDLHELAEQANAHMLGNFSYGAVFAVRSHLIQRLPNFSLRLMREFVKAPECHGYIMERLWLHLFGEPFILQRQAVQQAPVKLSVAPPQMAALTA